MKQFSPKDPEEIIDLSVSFVDVLRTGETITSASIKIEDKSGVEDPTMVSGPADISASPIVKFIVTGGKGCSTTYYVRVLINTSADRRLVTTVELPIQRLGGK